VEAFRGNFPAERIQETKPTSASEDFGCFGSEWQAPAVFWFIGGIDENAYATAKATGKLSEIPTNHNPRFAPVIRPTLETGVQAMVVAAQAWLSPPHP
jgi:hippurate hydrolase